MPIKPFEPAHFDAESIGEPPVDWKPSWLRWKAVLHRAEQLELRAAHFEAQASALETEAGKSASTWAAERKALTDRLESAELRTIPGLVEPDAAIFRSRYEAETADHGDKRPEFTAWARAQAKNWSEKPEEAPRWARGYLGEQQEAAPASATPADPAARQPWRPPSDDKRQPPPPPKSGFTAEQIAAMSPAEYKARKESGQLGLDTIRPLG